METRSFIKRVSKLLTKTTMLLVGGLIVSSFACRQADSVGVPSKSDGNPDVIVKPSKPKNSIDTHQRGVAEHDVTLTTLSDDSLETQPIGGYNGLQIYEVHKSLQGKVDRFGFLMSPGTSDGIMFYDLKDTELVLMLFVSKNQIVTAIEFGYVWPKTPRLKLNKLPKQGKVIEIIQ